MPGMKPSLTALLPLVFHYYLICFCLIRSTGERWYRGVTTVVSVACETWRTIVCYNREINGSYLLSFHKYCTRKKHGTVHGEGATEKISEIPKKK